MTTGPEAGYYADPSIPGYIRYWDGTQWVAGTSRPAQDLLARQQQQEEQRAVQQAVVEQLQQAQQAPVRQPSVQAAPAQQPPAAPSLSPEPAAADQSVSVATMVVPSAYGSRSSNTNTYTYSSGSPFDAIPGLYRGADTEPDEDDGPDVRVVELASAGSRVLARIIDLGIATVLSTPATVTLILVAHRHDHAYVDQLRLQAKTTYRTLGMDAVGIALWVAVVLVVLLTTIVFDAVRLPRTGQSTGRRLVGVQVINVGTAANPSAAAVLTRGLSFWLFALIPVIDVLALGGILWGRPYRQGLHEKLSGTVSIRA
jgi:hypothetical protein